MPHCFVGGRSLDWIRGWLKPDADTGQPGRDRALARPRCTAQRSRLVLPPAALAAAQCSADSAAQVGWLPGAVKDLTPVAMLSALVLKLTSAPNDLHQSTHTVNKQSGVLELWFKMLMLRNGFYWDFS